MKEKMNHVMDDLSAKAGEVGAKVREGSCAAGEYTKAGLEKTTANVREHPLGALGTVFGIGVAVGLLIGLTSKGK